MNTLDGLRVLLCALFVFSFGMPVGCCSPKLSLDGVVLSPLSSGAFPIAVWLQEPNLSNAYKAAGINLYVGLWQGPTEKQLSDLKVAGMPVICEQNSIGLKHIDDSIIVGWLQQDEPDNAQQVIDKQTGKVLGYGPCVRPDDVVSRYKSMRSNDPSRPVLLGLGQGVANDSWIGRGNGSQLSDYTTYVHGGDILSFDVYPIAGLTDPDKLWYVAKGLDRLKIWSGGTTALWEAIECTNIGGKGKPTPDQVRSEVWMALIHGATGIIYFVHQFAPTFDEAALLHDPDMLSAITTLNRQIQLLSPILDSPDVENLAVVTSSNPQVPISIMNKRRGNTDYVFAVSMRNDTTNGAFTIHELPPRTCIEVIGENRILQAVHGIFTDSFTSYEVHLYKIR